MECHNLWHLRYHNKYYDKSGCSLFPKPFDNGLRLKDFLESEIDERYYLNEEYIKRFIESQKNYNHSPSNCLTNRMLQIGSISPSQQNSVQFRIYDKNGICPTIRTPSGGHTEPKITEGMKLRKLTPLECWRLMGFSDGDFDKAVSTGNSNTQLYKQAGNSIVVNTLVEIYKCLQAVYPNDFKPNMSMISLFSGIGAFEKALERL